MSYGVDVLLVWLERDGFEFGIVICIDFMSVYFCDGCSELEVIGLLVYGLLVSVELGDFLFDVMIFMMC